ncbi:MAG: hypothetical protein HZA50_08550 [Planctomycetes bacterium]|nr:hypothetical protein [Planctomycetota bacterium]
MDTSRKSESKAKAAVRFTPALASAMVLAFLLTGAFAGPPERKGPPDRSKAEDKLSKTIPADAGSNQAPVLFCIGIHVEPMGATVSKLAQPDRQTKRDNDDKPDYTQAEDFKRAVEQIKTIQQIVDKHNGRMTVQVQSPFTITAAQNKDSILADLAKDGHEIALHFHEDAHLGRNCESLPVKTWTAVMAEEIGYIRKAVGSDIKVRYWSGGNNYSDVLDAANAAGLDVMSDHKNPKVQKTFDELISIWPWRPADGPTADGVIEFAKNDPAGKIVYLPDGIFASGDFASRKKGSDADYLDFITDGLERSLRAARKDRVNVFHLTAHPGEFKGGPNGRFTIVDQWLTQVVDPLVKAGKVKWATFSQMADAFAAWEKTPAGQAWLKQSQSQPAPNGQPQTQTKSDKGVVPALKKPSADVPAGSEGRDVVPSMNKPSENAAPEDSKPAPARIAWDPGVKGYITFAVNIHDYVHADQSAEIIQKLVKIFQKYKVKGDFYFIAQVAEEYAARYPQAIKAVKDGGICVSYHVRPPSPMYNGFDEPLKKLGDKDLAATLRDYETYRLDLATGGLDKTKPGGYAYVARVFGCNPVCVSPQTSDRRIKSAVDAIYKDMGAKMVLAYHESGTKIDQPFEYLNGLLIRPSDFSVTRWSLPGEPEDSFWWNRVGGQRASDKFIPVNKLKELAGLWKADRPFLATALIHENNFYRRGPEAWKPRYLDDEKHPLKPPYNLNAPDESKDRPQKEQDAILKAYEDMVAWAAANLKVATSQDIVKLADGKSP